MLCLFRKKPVCYTLTTAYTTHRIANSTRDTSSTLAQQRKRLPTAIKSDILALLPSSSLQPYYVPRCWFLDHPPRPLLIPTCPPLRHEHSWRKYGHRWGPHRRRCLALPSGLRPGIYISSRRAATYHDDRNTGRTREGREKSYHINERTIVPYNYANNKTNSNNKRKTRATTTTTRTTTSSSLFVPNSHHKIYTQHGHTSRSVPPALTAWLKTTAA